MASDKVVALITTWLLMLYNILLPINQYSGSIAKDAIAKTMNKIRISHGYFI